MVLLQLVLFLTCFWSLILYQQWLSEVVKIADDLVLAFASWPSAVTVTRRSGHSEGAAAACIFMLLHTSANCWGSSKSVQSLSLRPQMSVSTAMSLSTCFASEMRRWLIFCFGKLKPQILCIHTWKFDSCLLLTKELPYIPSCIPQKYRNELTVHRCLLLKFTCTEE